MLYAITKFTFASNPVSYMDCVHIPSPLFLVSNETLCTYKHTVRCANVTHLSAECIHWCGWEMSKRSETCVYCWSSSSIHSLWPLESNAEGQLICLAAESISNERASHSPSLFVRRPYTFHVHSRSCSPLSISILFFKGNNEAGRTNERFITRNTICCWFSGFHFVCFFTMALIV